MKKLIYTLAVWLCVTPAFAREQAPVKTGEQTVAGALDAWVLAVEGGSVPDIVALYDHDAIMISTFVQSPITNRKGLIGYYKKVVANPDVRVVVEESHPRRFGQTAVNTGRYTLSYMQEGEEVSTPARFSFTYVLRNGKWVIVDHHSSRVPLPEDK